MTDSAALAREGLDPHLVGLMAGASFVVELVGAGFEAGQELLADRRAQSWKIDQLERLRFWQAHECERRHACRGCHTEQELRPADVAVRVDFALVEDPVDGFGVGSVEPD